MFLTSRRAVISGAGALAATKAWAQTPDKTPAPTPLPRVALKTAAGLIVIELAIDRAPITSANFLRYVDARRFDGVTFYRAMKLAAAPPLGVIQGGANNDPARLFPPIAHESTQTTGLTHRDGAVSMARYAPGTATGDFFICLGNLTSLDAAPGQPGDNAGFAAFGHVVEGMDVARAILSSPISPTKGADFGMKGQMLDPEAPIVSAVRV